MTNTVLLASNNGKKLAELRRILAPLIPGITVVGLADVEPYDEPAETEPTFEGNALIKARAGRDRTGLPTLADDSGLCVDELGGMPGVLSARWSGVPRSEGGDAANNRLLLAQLGDVPDERRTAAFTCVVALCLPDGTEVTATGQMPGRVLREERGEGGFGYDPLFLPDGHDASAAELPPAEKDAISHRGRALRSIAPAVAEALSAATGGLDVAGDIVNLTRQLVDLPSESLHEDAITDAVEASLRAAGHLRVVRDGNTLIASTDLGRDERVVIAGHLDTVPANDNLPSRLDGEVLWGLGSCDMKGGAAIALKLACEVAEPVRDVTWVFYEAEEIAAVHNGLGRIARERPELLAGDFAILMEPSCSRVEAGCQGTMRVELRTSGERAHSARWWMGSNAIHALSPALSTLVAYQPREVEIDGLTYREGLNAVGVGGGVSGNVIPDEAVLTVNYRFAPDRDEAAALSHLREVFTGFDLTVTDSAPGALPGLDRPAAAAFVAAVGGEVGPKFGWTDVAKFTLLGIPAVNYGPGDPIYAHKADEQVPIAHLYSVLDSLRGWLTRL